MTKSAAGARRPLVVTDVRITRVEHDVLLAFATIVLNDNFAIRALKVIRGQNGVFVAMPARKNQDGSFGEVAHPMTRESRDAIDSAVMKAYDDGDGLEGAGVGSPLSPPPPAISRGDSHELPSTGGLSN